MKQLTILIMFLGATQLKAEIGLVSKTHTTLIGTEKINAIERGYYVFTIFSDNSILVESYKESKDQVSYCGSIRDQFECNSPELLSLKPEQANRNKDVYNFGKKGYFLEFKDGEWKFTKGGSEIKLEELKESTNKIKGLRNRSLMNYAYYSADSLLDLERKLSDQEQIKVRKALRNSELNSQKEELEYSEFKEMLLLRLKEVLGG